MAIYGLRTLGSFACGIASRYYHIRPELTRAGLKNLAQGGFVGVAMQVVAVAAALHAEQFGSNNTEKKQWFRFAYMTTFVASISVLPPLAHKLHFTLPYKEVVTTASLLVGLAILTE
ncbi:MAG: hypothetical protein KBA81_03420 [Rhabdochlamydiaceae bacterium]|nr:hypothetical protein [Rhabdochlamydiaceae bacterium]